MGEIIHTPFHTLTITLLAERNMFGIWGSTLMSLMLLPWPVKDYGGGGMKGVNNCQQDSHTLPSPHTHMDQRLLPAVHHADHALVPGKDEQRGPRLDVHAPLADVELLGGLVE